MMNIYFISANFRSYTESIEGLENSISIQLISHFRNNDIIIKSQSKFQKSTVTRLFVSFWNW